MQYSTLNTDFHGNIIISLVYSISSPPAPHPRTSLCVLGFALMHRYLSKWGLLFVPAQVAGKMQTSDTSLHIPRFPEWLINCFLPYQLFFLITGGQLAWTNTFREALFPIYTSFTGFLLSQPYLYLCSIQDVIKLKAKANVRVIMRQIRLKRSLFFFLKTLHIPEVPAGPQAVEIFLSCLDIVRKVSM